MYKKVGIQLFTHIDMKKKKKTKIPHIETNQSQWNSSCVWGLGKGMNPNYL